MKKRVLSMLMTLALCLTLFPAPAWATEDAPEGGAIVQQEQQEEAPAEETDTPEIGATVQQEQQQEQQEEQQEAPAAEPSTILEQAAENGIAAQNGGDSTVENAVAEVTVNGSTTPYADIDAAFAAAQQADSATVKLLADVTIRHEDYSGIKLEKGNITLDLNGKTLSKSTRDDNVFYARNAVFWLSPPEATTKDEFLAALQTHARLTVQDSSADRSGKIVQPNGGPAVIVALNTILTVNGGTIENASSVDLDDDSHLKPNCAVLLSGGGKAVINGGTLRGMRGVAVTGYITKEVEGLYKDTFGIEGYNNDTYGNELTVTGGNICATSGEGLIVYEKAKKIELSGGTFTTQSNAYSIWVADTKDGEQTFKGDASSLLASGCRYENNGTECVYSEDGKGVTGNATVALRPANEYAYIDKNGNLATQANCTEITERTDDISTPGWYVVKENLTISLLNISGEVNLILCDGATLTVTSFMNVTQGSTLNLYWQSAGTGKLTAAAISVLGTVTAPAGEMKRTTGEGGTTFEKCFEHDWGYTNNGDTHTAMCKLCGKAEAAESHKYDSWAPTDANTHTGTCACGATKTEGHTLTCTPNADGLTHSTKCSVCGYTAAAESHDFNQTDNYGKKCACGAYLAAECNGQQYATLARAIEAANGADITLLTIVSENVVVDGASIKAGIILGNGKTIDDIPYPSNWVADRNGIPLTMEAGEITLKDGALAQFTGYASANNAIALKGGTLTVADTVTKIIGSVASESGQRAAIEATGGVLDLQGNTLLDGGLTMSGDAQLKNKLTAGTFTNSGSETYSVSVEGSSQYTTVFDLLETGYAFAVYNKDAPTGDVIAKDTTTRELTEDVAVIKCTHKGANNKSLFKDNTCTGCGFTCAHETIKNGVCTVCNTAMGAQDNTGKYYLNLAEAFEGVADGGTVTMLTTLTDDDTISFCCDAEGNPVEKTVTLMMNGHSLSYEGASSLNIQSGKLIIGDEVTISQPARAAVPAVFVDNNEQSKDRGTLEFKGKANLTGGLLIQNWGKLEGGLKEGTIITSNGTYSVSVERSETYSNVLGLLGDGLAFAKKDHPDELVNGNVKQLTEDVIVVAHKHSPKYTQNPDPDALQTYIYICDCGFVCPHDRFTNSICDICHAACTHDEYTSDDKCARCGAPFAVRVECTDSVGITSNKLYMKTTTQDGTDDTLRQVFNEAADGSTITLLANGMLPSGIYASKTLTLDLNGHSLSGYSLNVGGLTPTSQVRTGNLTVIDSSGGNGAVGVTVRDGGTLVFDPKNDSTTLLQLEVWGGTVELYGGKISRQGLRLNNSITLGNLLPQNAGLAYYCGDTQLTLEEAASKTCDLVVKSCAHGGKNGFDENATACPYCNAPAVAETALNNGESGRLQRRFADLQTALDADRDGGAELTLLADVTGDYTIDGTKVTGLNLNGHSIKGTVTVKAATGSNTTTLSNTKNTTTASIDKVVAFDGAELAGSRFPAVIGTLTLADGATWKNILNLKTLGYKVLNGEGTHQWYAPNDVKGSQLNNVIINSLPITTKTLNLKVNGTNVNKVERGTTVQLCASCNTNGADVTFSILKKGETTPITLTKPSYAGGKYTKDYSFDTIGEYTIYFTATKDGYSVQSAEKKLTVTKATIPASAITAPAANALTYNGNEQALITAGSVTDYGTMQYSLTKNGTYSPNIPTGTDAGTYTVWYRVIGDANHNDTAPASVAVSIRKKPLTITGVTAASKPYDGTTNAGITSVTFDGVTLNLGTDYNVAASFDEASVGNGKNVTATVTLIGQAAQNYALEQSSFPTTGSITKAAAPDFTKETSLAIINGYEKTYTVTLPALPTLETPKEYGAPTYELGEIKLNDGYYTDGAKVENGKMTLPIQKNDVGTTGPVGTVTVVIKSKNYEDITLTVNVNAANKIEPTPDGEITATAITYGDTLSKSKISGKMKDPDTGDAVNGTFTWMDGTVKPDAGSNNATWTFTPDASYGGKYTTNTGTATVTVNRKTVMVSGITASDKVYDGTTNAKLNFSNAKFAGVLENDTLTVTAKGVFEKADIGKQKVTISNLTLGGASAANYVLAESGNQTETTANITAKQITVTITPNGGTYGSVIAAAAELSGAVDGENIPVTLTYTGNNYSSATVPVNAGSYKVTASIANSNYTLTGNTTAAFVIAPKAVTVSGITAKDKVYDGTTDATLDCSNAKFDGILKNDKLTVAAKGMFEKAVAGKQNVAISGLTLGGASAANYVLAESGNQTETTANITAKQITVTITPNGGTYGSVIAAAAELSGAVDGENIPVTLTYTGNNYSSATVPVNAGSYKVTASIANSNYTLTGNTTAAFVIAPKAVTVSGITAKDKVYDGTTDATLDCSNAKFDGILKNDKLTVAAKGMFEKAVAGKQNVAISGLTLGGASAANYVLAESGNQTETTATITAKEVTVTITPNGGTYGSVVAAAAELSGAVKGENIPVTLTYTGNGYDATAVPVNAGSYKVTASIANSNYTLTRNTTADFVITPKAVTVTGITAKDKVYDGATDATLDCSNAQFDGILKNDKLTVAAKGMFEKAVAGKQNVAISGLTLGGASAANYVLAGSGNQAETTATITAKQVTVTITPNGGTYGSVIAAAANLSGAVKGENVPVTLTYTGTANDGTEYNGTTPPTKAGTYTITATITDPNYKLDADTATAEFTVAKRSATVTPDNKSKVYEEKDPELTYKVSGVLDGEMLKGITLARAKGENAGKYAITVTADVSANPNYDVTFAEGTFTIEPKSIKGATVVLGKGLAANGAKQTQTVEKVLLGDKEIPADSYTVTGNTATAHGIYTLTITAKGNYTDSIAWTYVIAPSKAEDAPGEDIAIGSGKVKVVVLPEGAVPSVGLLTDKAELLAMLVNSGDITADELVQIANGASVDIVLTVKEANVPDVVKTAMAQAAKGYTIGQYLDISLFKYMTVNGNRQPDAALHTTKNALPISVVVPDALINTNSAVNRTYCIVRNHEGTITVLDAAFDAANKTLTFKTDRFSVYAIAYKDTAVPSSGSNPGSNNSSNDSETKKNEVAPTPAPTPASTPARTSKPSTITAMPQTGDTSNPTLYVVLLVVSLLGLAVIFVCKRRNNK